jgi:hypothetical protein
MSEAVNEKQVDKRAILAVIEAVVHQKEPTLIIKYKDIKSYLALIFAVEDELDDYEKYKKTVEELYNALVNRRLKYVYPIYKDKEFEDFDLILISPIELSEEQLRNLSEAAVVVLNDHDHDAEAINTLSHVVVWLAKRDSVTEALADAITALARGYGIDERYVKRVLDFLCIKFGACRGE